MPSWSVYVVGWTLNYQFLLLHDLFLVTVTLSYIYAYIPSWI